MRLPKTRLFDYTTPGKGVSKDEKPKKGIALFWDILVRRFWKLVSLNFLYIVFSIPALVIGWFIIAFLTSSIMAAFFPEVAINMEQSAETGQALSQMCLYITCFIFSIFGSGAATAGVTKVIRNYCLDRHSWVWADFWSTFKKHFFKGIVVYVIDMLFLSVLTVNFCFYGIYAEGSIVSYLLQGFMALIFFIFFLMHAYIYPIMVTFPKKKVWEIYKNAFILSMGKLPVTFASMALCALVCLIIISLAFFVTIYAMLLIPIVLFAFIVYLNLFITYPMVQKYMGKKRDEE